VAFRSWLIAGLTLVAGLQAQAGVLRLRIVPPEAIVGRDASAAFTAQVEDSDRPGIWTAAEGVRWTFTDGSGRSHGLERGSIRGSEILRLLGVRDPAGEVAATIRLLAHQERPLGLGDPVREVAVTVRAEHPGIPREATARLRVACGTELDGAAPGALPEAPVAAPDGTGLGKRRREGGGEKPAPVRKHKSSMPGSAEGDAGAGLGGGAGVPRPDPPGSPEPDPTEEKPFKCGQCAKRFKKVFNLNQHVRTHTGEKPYPCDRCETSFARQADLTVHKRIHTGERPYECDVCKKGFSKKSKLKIHTRTHTGEKPFKCNLCEKHFSQTGARDRHERAHSQEDRFECDACGREFNRKDSLARHMATHAKRPFQCKKCKIGFAKSSQLTAHRRTHTREMPYPCTECDKSFSYKSSLQKHLDTHAGAKPSKAGPKRGLARRVPGSLEGPGPGTPPASPGQVLPPLEPNPGPTVKAEPRSASLAALIPELDLKEVTLLCTRTWDPGSAGLRVTDSGADDADNVAAIEHHPVLGARQKGLQARRALVQGQRIAWYEGEFLAPEAFQARFGALSERAWATQPDLQYLVTIALTTGPGQDPDLRGYLDGYRDGEPSLAALVNHSREANAELRVQVTEGGAGAGGPAYRAALVALEDIAEGQEILLDYGGDYARDLERSRAYRSLAPSARGNSR